MSFIACRAVLFRCLIVYVAFHPPFCFLWSFCVALSAAVMWKKRWKQIWRLERSAYQRTGWLDLWIDIRWLVWWFSVMDMCVWGAWSVGMFGEKQGVSLCVLGGGGRSHWLVDFHVYFPASVCVCVGVYVCLGLLQSSCQWAGMINGLLPHEGATESTPPSSLEHSTSLLPPPFHIPPPHQELVFTPACGTSQSTGSLHQSPGKLGGTMENWSFNESWRKGSMSKDQSVQMFDRTIKEPTHPWLMSTCIPKSLTATLSLRGVWGG